MIRRPPRSTQSRSSAASDVYKRQQVYGQCFGLGSIRSQPVLWSRLFHRDRPEAVQGSVPNSALPLLPVHRIPTIRRAQLLATHRFHPARPLWQLLVLAGSCGYCGRILADHTDLPLRRLGSSAFWPSPFGLVDASSPFHRCPVHIRSAANLITFGSE